MQVGDHVVTQKSLYTGLFVIGLPLLWWSSPLGTFFWLVGASGVLIFAHASMIEPGVESEYAAVQDGVWDYLAAVCFSDKQGDMTDEWLRYRRLWFLLA
jgi:PRA1 family protein